MAAELGSLTSSPPLSFKMRSKVSITSLGGGWAMPAVAEEEGTMSAVAEEEGTMSAVAEEEGAQQAPQKAPQQPTEEAEEEAMSAAPEAEAAETEAEAAVLRGIRRQCSLLVSTHEPTPHALLGKKVPTRRPLPPVGNVLRL